MYQQSMDYIVNYKKEEMSEIEDIRNQYLKDADLIGSKSRFGYFSIPPPAGTGQTMFEQKKAQKDENGRVITQEIGILVGPMASGTMKKSYFQYSKSVFQGDPYTDPGKTERLESLQKQKKLVGKEVYKPLSLAKSPSPKASYQYIPQKPIKRTVKDCVDADGKVKIQQRNITTNPQSKIEKERRKEQKYVANEYQNHLKVARQEHKKSVQKRGQGPFKSSSPMKDYFGKPRQIFGELDQVTATNKIQQTKNKLSNSALKLLQQQDGPFKPSCTKKLDTFSYPEYMAGGAKIKLPNNNNSSKSATDRAESFRLVKQPNNYKPSPSITTMRSNMMRKIR